MSFMLPDCGQSLTSHILPWNIISVTLKYKHGTYPSSLETVAHTNPFQHEKKVSGLFYLFVLVVLRDYLEFKDY